MINEQVVEQIVVRLETKHSPEQISGSLALCGHSVSTSTIYKHVFADKKAGGDLHTNLQINGHRRYRRRNKAVRTKIPERIDISQRPAVVDLKARYGDWEADLIEGARSTGYILCLYERKCHFGILIKLKSNNSEITSQAIIKALSSFSRQNHHLRQWP